MTESPPTMNTQRPLSTGGFTLLELLAVMSIIMLVTAFISPAVSSTVMGTNLNRAGKIVTDYIALARQEAVSMNRDVQVRFIEENDGAQTRTRGIQLVRVDENASGVVNRPITRVAWFPEQIAVNLGDRFSPLLSTPTLSGTNYRGFRIKANGKLDNATDTPFLTLQNVHDAADQPRNFYTIRINPFTGRTTVFRP